MKKLAAKAEKAATKASLMVSVPAPACVPVPVAPAPPPLSTWQNDDAAEQGPGGSQNRRSSRDVWTF